MFEEIIALKIQDPKTGLVSNTFVKNAEEYSEIMSNQYICSCIIEQEKAYMYSDIPPEFKRYDCPYVYLTKEEKEAFEQMLIEETDEQIIEGSYKGSFKLQLVKKSLLEYLQFLIRLCKYKIKKETFYYGEHSVHIGNNESNIFETQFEDPYAPKIFRRRNKIQ